MTVEKMTVEPRPSNRDHRTMTPLTHPLVIPNRAEGRVRDLTSDATIPAVNGTSRLNPPPLDVIPGVTE
jgi:hypothetical protein